jgi:hypothetical protein
VSCVTDKASEREYLLGRNTQFIELGGQKVLQGSYALPIALIAAGADLLKVSSIDQTGPEASWREFPREARDPQDLDRVVMLTRFTCQPRYALKDRKQWQQNAVSVANVPISR